MFRCENCGKVSEARNAEGKTTPSYKHTKVERSVVYQGTNEGEGKEIVIEITVCKACSESGLKTLPNGESVTRTHYQQAKKGARDEKAIKTDRD
jgi:hypothetical protein